jgi:hypothetical protein
MFSFFELLIPPNSFDRNPLLHRFRIQGRGRLAAHFHASLGLVHSDVQYPEMGYGFGDKLLGDSD